MRLRPPPTDPAPDLDHIDILELMATGKRTTTWDAFDTVRRTRCIVKVIRAHRRGDNEIRTSVIREGVTLQTLSHPHLVRGYGMFGDAPDADGPVGFTMQTVPGATLDVVIDDGCLDAADTVELGLQVSSALQYLHGHNWIHLDVKPSNIIVHGGQATLIDLGLLTGPGERRAGAGTRGYLAPEQADGRALTPAADTFSLGVTLVESLSGQRPFGREAVWSSRRRIPLREGRMPRRPAGVPEHLPAGLRDLLLEMVHLDPARRPSMCDVWQRLSSLSRTTTRSAATPDTGQPASSPAHAKRRR